MRCSRCALWLLFSLNYDIAIWQARRGPLCVCCAFISRLVPLWISKSETGEREKSLMWDWLIIQLIWGLCSKQHGARVSCSVQFVYIVINHQIYYSCRYGCVIWCSLFSHRRWCIGYILGSCGLLSTACTLCNYFVSIWIWLGSFVGFILHLNRCFSGVLGVTELVLETIHSYNMCSFKQSSFDGCCSPTTICHLSDL